MKPELVRWTLCAALVATAHILVVYELARRAPVLDSDAGSPVITLDLSPIPAAPTPDQTPTDTEAEAEPVPAQAAASSEPVLTPPPTSPSDPMQTPEPTKSAEPTPSPEPTLTSDATPELTPSVSPTETPSPDPAPSPEAPPPPLPPPSREPSEPSPDSMPLPSPPPETPPPPSPEATPPPPTTTPSPEPIQQTSSDAADAAPPPVVAAPNRAPDERAAPGREDAEARTANRSWQGSMIAQIERHKSFPSGARGRSGVVGVAFAIDRSGHLTELRLQRSSGDPALDEAALDLIRRSQPFPPPPAALSQRELSIVSSVRYLRPARR